MINKFVSYIFNKQLTRGVSAYYKHEKFIRTIIIIMKQNFILHRACHELRFILKKI